MKTLNKQFCPNGGIACVYRLVLPTGWRGLFHNVLSLSPYLELRERFPYLTHSCKSQLNSSNSENELQRRLLSIWAQGSCQGWGGLADHPSVQIYGPHRLLGLREHLPRSCHTPHTYAAGGGWCKGWCVWLQEWGRSHGGVLKPHKNTHRWQARTYRLHSHTFKIIQYFTLFFFVSHPHLFFFIFSKEKYRLQAVVDLITGYCLWYNVNHIPVHTNHFLEALCNSSQFCLFLILHLRARSQLYSPSPAHCWPYSAVGHASSHSGC